MANNVVLGACRNPVKTVGPTGAAYQNPEDGVILIDQNLCIGGKSCANICPCRPWVNAPSA